jgi:NAD(P)-dependent dehydrogenase (short-subunit alcohol dehydrogenase family)
MTLQLDRTGRTALITGAGQGVGRGLAIAFAAAGAGAEVLVNDLRDERADTSVRSTSWSTTPATQARRDSPRGAASPKPTRQAYAIAPESLSASMRSQSMPTSMSTSSVCSEACGARVVSSGSWLN